MTRGRVGSPSLDVEGGITSLDVEGWAVLYLSGERQVERLRWTLTPGSWNTLS